MLNKQPISFKEAKIFIAKHHRHHFPPQGWKFGIAAHDGEKIVGVVTVGRPLSRYLDNGLTLTALAALNALNMMVGYCGGVPGDRLLLTKRC